MTEDEKLRQNESALAAKIARLLPDFAKSCREKADAVIIHQYLFAADYQDDEYALLGMAIKVCGATRERSPHPREKQGNTQRVRETRTGAIET